MGRYLEMINSPADVKLLTQDQLITLAQEIRDELVTALSKSGGHLGPNLTSVGSVRTERDLLEAVVYPSASFVRGYEPMILVTKSGEQLGGVLHKDAPDEVVIATGPETETRVARAEIAELRPGTVSLMPQGLDAQMSPQDLADLIAFLKSMK